MGRSRAARPYNDRCLRTLLVCREIRTEKENVCPTPTETASPPSRRTLKMLRMKSLIELPHYKQITILCVSLAFVSLVTLAAADRQIERPATHGDRAAESGEGLLDLDTSDANLGGAFGWARRQALAYAFRGDPVGDWYEAAL